MSSEDHPSQLDVGDWLRRGDPYRGERLDDNDEAAMREATIRAHATASRGRRRRLAVAACLLLALLLTSIFGDTLRRQAPMPDPTVLPSVPQPTVGFAPPDLVAAPSLVPPEPGSAAVASHSRPNRRSIRFVAPGGTRIVWTLDPTFDLDPTTR